MGLFRDERGQAIQVGAAILLAFVVVAITLYQVHVVPGQNAEVEFDHSQAVQEDVLDVRNAVANAGASERTEARSVALGTTFPARTVFVNPPPSVGSLRTVDAGNVSIRNAQVDPDAAYGSDAAALLAAEHATARIVYEPSYRTYGGDATTVVEHSLAYEVARNDATTPLSRQTLVRDDRLALTLVDGDLEEQGSRSITVEAATVSGPSDPIPIVPDDASQPIAVDLPVATPAPWNQTVGRTYSNGQSGARVAAYDDADATLTVELDRDVYDLRMSLVSVGGNASSTERYDVTGPGSEPPAYDVGWQDPSGQSGVDDGRCDADRCVVTGGSVDLTTATDPVADGADVTYAVGDRSVGTVSPETGDTDGSGRNATTFDVDPGANAGETVYVYASSGSAGDRIELEIG